jgi:Arrestin (or S-antigen), C-terminal domain
MNSDFKSFLVVYRHVDLNYDTPALRIPSQMEMTKTFCCGPCRSAPLSLSAQIPMSGYAPGQAITISASIHNGSRIDVDEIKFMLQRNVIYVSHTPRSRSRNEIDTVAETRQPGVARKKSNKFLADLVIPPIPPTNIILCRVIQISYEVVVEAKVGGAHQNPRVRIPITIGTVPLVQQQMLPFPIEQSLPTAPNLDMVTTPIVGPLTNNGEPLGSRMSEIRELRASDRIANLEMIN